MGKKCALCKKATGRKKATGGKKPGAIKKKVKRISEDNERYLDGCEVHCEHPTLDEDLPAAEGGVA